MASEARFGIELYEHPSDDRIGHVWSPDAELIVRGDGDTVQVTDPSGAIPHLLNTSRETLGGFLEAFRVFYLGDRPTVVPAMTPEEARARLAAIHRGETPPARVAPTPAPSLSRPERLATLRAALETADAAALAEGTWWGRILRRPEFTADGAS